MNIIADNHINIELQGGEVWWGKICDTLAANYISPGARFKNIQKTKGFVQDSLSFKPLDRSEVRTKDLIIDGQTYDQHYEPFQLAARNMWRDIEGYEHLFGQDAHSHLQVELPRL